MAARRPVSVAVHSQRTGRVIGIVNILMDPDRMTRQLFDVMAGAIEGKGFVVLGIISAEAPFGRKVLSIEKDPGIKSVEWITFVRE